MGMKSMVTLISWNHNFATSEFHSWTSVNGLAYILDLL